MPEPKVLEETNHVHYGGFAYGTVAHAMEALWFVRGVGRPLPAGSGSFTRPPAGSARR